MDSLARAFEIQAAAAAAVAGLDPLPLVTLDSTEIEPALAGGDPVVCVQPPAARYPSFHQADLTWELFVIAGPPHDRLEQWRRIDAVLGRLTGAGSSLAIESAEPSNYQPRSGQPVGAYIVTLAPETQVTT